MSERVVDVLGKQSTKGLPVMICRDDDFYMLVNAISLQTLYAPVRTWRIYGNKVVIEL